MHAIAAKFDLVTVRSPGVDRRALSQAWYDALHLASASAPRRENISLLNARRFVNPVRPLVSARGRGTAATLPPHRGASTTASRSEAYARDDKSSERRARVLPLAGDIVARLRSQPKATRFVFDVPQGRVCLYVVRGERRVQFAAFCSPVLRDVVERALAQVRYAL